MAGAAAISENATFTFDSSLPAIPAGALLLINKSDVLGSDHYYPSVVAFYASLNVRNLSQVFDSLATSLTNNVQSANNATIHVPGTSYQFEYYIHVHWPWIILPNITTTFSGVLLASTAWQSKRQNMILWKSSILPLIMRRLKTRDGDDSSKRLRNVDIA